MKKRSILRLAVISLLAQLVYGWLTGIWVSPGFASVGTITNICPLVSEGIKSYEAGYFSEAEVTWKETQQVYQNAGNKLCQAMALSNLSLAYQQQGKLADAAKTIQQSLQLILVSPDTSIEQLKNLAKKLIQAASDNSSFQQQQLKVLAQALNTQGKLEFLLGQAEQALETWQQAGNAYNKVHDSVGAIRSQINQSQALQALGHYRDAGDILLQVLLSDSQKRHIIEQPDWQLKLKDIEPDLEKLPNLPTKVAILHSLGNVYLSLGNYPTATEVLQRAKELAKNLPSQFADDILLSLGNVELALASRSRDLEDVESAQTYARNAINFYHVIPTIPSSKITQVRSQLNELSLLLDTDEWLLEANKPDVAKWQLQIQDWVTKSKLSQLQTQLDALPLSSAKLYAQINLAQSLISLWEIKVSGAPTPEEISQRLNIAKTEAVNLLDKRAESYALGTQGKLYELVKNWREAENYTRQALSLAEESQARDILYRWEWQMGRIFRKQENFTKAIGIYKEAVETLQSLRDSLAGINSEVGFSFRDNVEPVYRELLQLLLSVEDASELQQDNLETAIEYVKGLQLAELENFLQCNLESQVPKVPEYEDLTAAIFYPIILQDRLEVILKLPNHRELIRYKSLVTRTELESKLKELRNLLMKRTSDRTAYESLSTQVYEWLIRPAEKYFNSTIKTLVFVPDGYLRNIPISALWDKEKHQYLVENYAVAITPDLSLLGPKPRAAKQPKALIAGLTIPSNPTVNGKLFSFPTLLYVQDEVDEIKKSLPNYTELLNQKFQAKNLRTQLKSSAYDIVHLATHGQFSSNLEETFLVSGLDTAIDFNEIKKLLQSQKQNPGDAIQFLVFSACETATGDKRATLGMAGVAVRAGAFSTLASLWSVNDKSTSILMGEFYHNLVKGLQVNSNQVTKAEALRQAQLYLLHHESEDYQHPYFWAPFVLVGNWL